MIGFRRQDMALRFSFDCLEFCWVSSSVLYFSFLHREANSAYDEHRKEPLVNSFGSISKLHVRLQTTLDLKFRRYCMHLSSRVHLSFSFIFQSTLNRAEKALQVFLSHQSEFLFIRRCKLIDLPNICYRQSPHSS